MSGTVIRVLEDQHFEFQNLGASGTQYVVPAQRIDTSQYREGALLVRIVQINIATPATDDIQIGVNEDAWDPFSGAIVFDPTPYSGAAGGSVVAPLAATTLNPNKGQSPDTPPTDPYALFFPLTGPFGGLLQVGVLGTRTGGTAGDALSVQLNADLILKD